MDSPLTINEQALVDALKSASEGEQDEDAKGALTTVELCKLMEWGTTEYYRERMNELLRELKERGWIEPVRKPIIDLCGRRTSTNAYRFKTGPLGELLNGDKGEK